MSNRGLSVLAVVNTAGETTLAQGMDLDRRELSDLDSAVASFIGKDNRLRVHHHADSLVKGLALFGGAPRLTASAPVLPTEAGGLIKGAVIVMRGWEEAEFVQLAEKNQMTVFQQAVEGSLSSDMRSYLRNRQGGQLADGMVGQPATTLLGENSVATYFALGDIYGNAGVVGRLTKRRESGQEAATAANRMGVFSLAAAAILFLCMMALLQITVLQRLRALTRDIREIKSADHMTDVSISVRGSDEVGKVAHGMRYVLDAMRANKFRWMRAERRLQELIELSPTGVILAEPVNHRLYRINDAALEILQTGREELTGKRIADVFAEIDGEDDVENLSEQLSEGMRQTRAKVFQGDGTRLEVDLKVGAMKRNEGELFILAFAPVCENG
jgi:PAS domain S-box-containing protein